MMRWHKLILLELIGIAVLAGCQTTRDDRSPTDPVGDHRQRQATLQTKEELEKRHRPTTRPIDPTQRQRQNVIDQPR